MSVTSSVGAAGASGSTMSFPLGAASQRGFSNKKITIWLDDHNFLLWKQQVYLMVKQHRLHRFLDGTIPTPPLTVRAESGELVPNPELDEFESLDSALASWLLASVAPSILPEQVGLEIVV